jgi:predicted RND superfamily exporter protein
MSSFTTLVGFGGMVMSQHMGLNSMGLLAILGISCCFATTFVIQPGLILLAEKFKLPGCVPDYDFKPENLNKD